MINDWNKNMKNRLSKICRAEFLLKAFLLLALVLNPVVPAKLNAAPDQPGKVTPPAAHKPRKVADPSLTPITDAPGLPRVLLIGDSISMGYTLPVRALLKGQANVHRIPTNGGSTKDGVAHIDEWLGNGKWEVIHFNWGLHDLKRMKDGKLNLAGDQVSTLAEYEANLRVLVKQMQVSGAKLIWATTTPVPEGSDGRPAREELKYNAVASRVMKDLGVPTDDLHACCLPNLAEWQLPKNVHFKPNGSDGLAEQAAAEIKAALKK
jgi:hypothetical protein